MVNLVSAAEGKLYARKDGKYLLYIPKSLAEDSRFPFKGEGVKVWISFNPDVKERILTVQSLENVERPE